MMDGYHDLGVGNFPETAESLRVIEGRTPSMRLTHILRLTAAAGLGATALTVVGLTVPAQARVADPGPACIKPTSTGVASSARGGASGVDHREISAAEQRAIERRTDSRLAGARGTTSLVGPRVPVHVHVMRDAAGRGNVTNKQIHRQVTVLNRDYPAFNFHLASINRFKNTTWHKDNQSARYRKLTRKGGANALNIWLVDFQFLGIATFPWDYGKRGAVDGIRVHYDSLPGGGIANFNLGGTATHETGHWLGLYHTFQGGCTQSNDRVNDTPAQSSPTSGCPITRDSCPMPGDDPVHNYMDYSIDRCYTEFTDGQVQRMREMWAAWRR
jgi:Pregnancy-associated plasma protein-A